MKDDEEKILFRLFLLKNDEKQSIEVEEVAEIDFNEVKKHIDHGESVFITRKREQKQNPSASGNVALNMHKGDRTHRKRGI